MHDIQLLSNTVIILLASFIVIVISKKLRISPVLGYFAAGAAIGNYGFNLISDHQTSTLSEFGIVFLLFAIGLELTYDRLKSMRSQVFGFGTLQVVISAVIIGLAMFLLVSHKGINLNAILVIGLGLALSSTAIVLQVVAEYRRQSTHVGRLSLSVLLLQDFAVVPLLVLIPHLQSNSASAAFTALVSAFIKGILVVLGIFILGRLLLRPILGAISSSTSAKTHELFVATTLLIALGAAWVTYKMGLSLALGAFVAGLLVAETEFQHQAEESIAPFRGLFLGLFFMTVGMKIDLHFILQEINLILLISAIVIIIKTAVIFALAIAFRYSIGTSIHAGLLLSQGGEFAFILFQLAADQKIMDPQLSQIMLLVVTNTMALTPLLFIIGDKVASYIDKLEKAKLRNMPNEVSDLSNHVIICGFGRVGKMVARLLEAEHVNYIALDIDEEYVIECQKEGFPVYCGDSSKVDILKALGIESALSVIVAMQNTVTTKRICKAIYKSFPDIPIVARAEDLAKADDLIKAGAKIIVPETYETGLQLGGAVLKTVGVSEFEVSRIKNRFRAGNYTIAKSIDEESSNVNSEANA